MQGTQPCEKRMERENRYIVVFAEAYREDRGFVVLNDTQKGNTDGSGLIEVYYALSQNGLVLYPKEGSSVEDPEIRSAVENTAERLSSERYPDCREAVRG